MFGNDNLERSARDLRKSIEKAKKERGAHVTIYGGVFGDFSKTLLDDKVQKDIKAMASIKLENENKKNGESEVNQQVQSG